VGWSESELLLNDGHVFAGVERDHALDPLQCFYDLVATPILLRILILRLAVAYDQEAALHALSFDHFAQLRNSVLLWRLVGEVDDDQICVVFDFEQACVHEALKTTDEGHHPLGGRNKLQILVLHHLFGQLRGLLQRLGQLLHHVTMCLAARLRVLLYIQLVE